MRSVALWYLRLRGNLGLSSGDSVRKTGRDTVKIFAGIAVRIVYVAATLAVVAAAAWGQASKQTSERTSQQLSDQLSHKEQCSLAVVSRLVGGNQPVCDG